MHKLRLWIYYKLYNNNNNNNVIIIIIIIIHFILFKTLTYHNKSTNADNSVTPVENFAPIKIKSFCYEVRTEDNVSVILQEATCASCIINYIPGMGIPVG